MRTLTNIEELLPELDHCIADELEDQDLDFKQWDTKSRDKAVKIVIQMAVCMANGGGGTVVFGVADHIQGRKNAILGVPPEIDANMLKKAVYDQTDPKIMPVFEELTVPEGTGRVLLMQVHPGMPPYTDTAGRGTIRVSKDCVPLTGTVRRKIGVETGETDYTAEPVAPVDSALLSATALEALRNQAGRERAPGDLLRLSDPELLSTLGLIKQGKLTRYKFYEGVMRSQARLTYTQVGALLEEPESETAQYLYEQHSKILPGLYELHQLYHALRAERDQRGAIDFETRETRIVFGDDSKIEKIIPVVRNDAHKIIEECMLVANVATARFLEKHELAGLYRVHEGPKAERLETLRAFLGELGIHLGGGDKPTPQDYQEVFNTIRERADADIIQTMMLRSMRQAVYTPVNEGHFGLAYPAYAHFTSPIRRYPDLLVHRAIRGLLRSGKPTNNVERLETTPTEKLEKWLPYTPQQMLELGEHCSMAERRADEAVRDVTDWLKCEFLSDHVGEVFMGRVASVVGFGLFVELNDFFVEGLVHISSLPGDYYRFEPEKQRLRGERSGRSWRLGDQVEVIVSRVDLDDRKIDFDLTETVATPARPPRKRRASSQRKPATSSKTSAKPKATATPQPLPEAEDAIPETPEIEVGLEPQVTGEIKKSKKKKAKKKKDKAVDDDKSKKGGKKRKKRPGKKERDKKKQKAKQD
jgi:ribonuclease R